MANGAKAAISPMLSVRHGAQAVEFYKKAFGAEEVFVLGDAENGIVAQLSVGGAHFWVADEAPEFGNFSPESMGAGFRGTMVRIVLVVGDPDEVFGKAVAAGAEVIAAVEDQEYGWRVGRVRDPYGHHWEIGRPL